MSFKENFSPSVQSVQMSRGNYHISANQVLESENKLKLMDWLKLRSSNRSEFCFKLFPGYADEPKETYFASSCSFEDFVNILSEIQKVVISNKI